MCRAAVATAGVCLAVAMGAEAQSAGSGAGGRPVVRAVRLDRPLSVDGRLDEDVYARETPITGFIQQEPQAGAPATEKTEVWVFYDDQRLYVSGRMWDSHPERMIANEMRRDAAADIYENENFAVTLDTFSDHRSGYYFMTNMLGAMRDVQITSEKEINGEWNPIWNPRAGRFEHGWTVEIEIPFKSVRYPSEGEETWGIQFRRVIRWKQEIVYLTPVPPSVGPTGVFRLQDAAVLSGLRTPIAGHNLELKPYASSRVTTDKVARPALHNDVDGDVGFDVKYGVTQSLTADFTYNTDFAQVEDDLQQVNLTRFNLFFPEKREFFLEGQGIFDFGGQTGGGNNPGAGDIPTMFFSRRIGLVQGVAVPIRGGARLTGKVGNYSVGLLDIQTGKSTAAAAPSTNFGVVRLRRDILGKSYVGLIATRRSPSGASGNTLFGADANIAYGVTTVNVYYTTTRTPGRSGDDASYLGLYDYNGDRYGVTLQHLAVQPNFNPEMGFLRRQDFRSSSVDLRFSPRPSGIKAVRKFYYQASLVYVTDNDNRLESRSSSVSFRTEFENGDRFSASFEPDFEQLDQPFQIARDVTIPAGGYAFHRGSLSYTIGSRFRVRGTVSATAGSFYGGTRSEARYSGRVALSQQLILEPTLSVNWVNLPWGVFRTDILSARTTYTLSPRSTLGALIQYNSSSSLVSSNVRLRWEYTPGSDLFVVYTEGRNTLVPDRFVLQNRAFVIKITRMFRY